jgi:hypothetical protein
MPCPRGAVTAASAVDGCPQTVHAMRPGRGAPPGSDQALMTPAERQAHRARLAAFTSYDECHAYALQHHQEMVARAQAKGASAAAAPVRDACARLQPPAK